MGPFCFLKLHNQVLLALKFGCPNFLAEFSAFSGRIRLSTNSPSLFLFQLEVAWDFNFVTSKTFFPFYWGFLKSQKNITLWKLSLYWGILRLVIPRFYCIPIKFCKNDKNQQKNMKNHKKSEFDQNTNRETRKLFTRNNQKGRQHCS